MNVGCVEMAGRRLARPSGGRVLGACNQRLARQASPRLWQRSDALRAKRQAEFATFPFRRKSFWGVVTRGLLAEPRRASGNGRAPSGRRFWPFAIWPFLPLPSPVSKAKTSTTALSFEDALAQIESIIERIESGEVGLEQSLTEYEKGVGLINHCRGKLDRARQQVEDLTKSLETADDGGSEDGEDDGGAEQAG